MITKRDVAHIADLARLALTSEEEERFAGELSAILDFVGELNELDTADVASMSGGTDLVNVMRDDGAHNLSLEGKAEALLAAVPEKKGALVKVRSVFG